MISRGRLPLLVNVSKLIGCTWPEFVAHIQSTWADWMTWENYGKWEIDHIEPLSSFDLNEPEELRACFHFKNCQALSKRDNRAKGNR